MMEKDILFYVQEGEVGFVKSENEDENLIFCFKNKLEDYHKNVDVMLFKETISKKHIITEKTDSYF